MVDEVSQDNGRGGTSDANNREYGGYIKDGLVTPVTPGAITDPRTSSQAEIRLPLGLSTFHGHPSGTTTVRESASFNTVGARSSTTYSFDQHPSRLDISNAGNNPNYVFGRDNGTTYIYNSSDVQATIPTKYFVNPR